MITHFCCIKGWELAGELFWFTDVACHIAVWLSVKKQHSALNNEKELRIKTPPEKRDSKIKYKSLWISSGLYRWRLIIGDDQICFWQWTLYSYKMNDVGYDDVYKF